MIVDYAHVLESLAETCGSRYRNVLDKISGVSVEVLHTTLESLIEETEIQTEVCSIAGLPTEILVGKGGEYAARLAHILIGI